LFRRQLIHSLFTPGICRELTPSLFPFAASIRFARARLVDSLRLGGCFQLPRQRFQLLRGEEQQLIWIDLFLTRTVDTAQELRDSMFLLSNRAALFLERGLVLLDFLCVLLLELLEQRFELGGIVRQRSDIRVHAVIKHTSDENGSTKIAE
jgi:hypothetical protein